MIKHTTVGRDHYPVVTTVGTKACYDKGKKIPRWKLANANWDAFQEISASRCLKLQEENQVDVNIFNSALVNERIQSAKETIPKSTGARCTKNVPWWKSDCYKAIKARNKAFRKLKKFHSQDIKGPRQ